MGFYNMVKKLQKHFTEMTRDVEQLFEVEVDKDALWNLYLDSFPEGKNEIYRERREHDCCCCRHFIKSFGNVVVIKDNEVHTIWEFDSADTTYQPVLDAMDAYIKSRPVTNIHVSKMSKIGTAHNFETMPDGNVHKWEHFYLELPRRFVDTSYRSEGDIKGTFRDTKNVFKRSLDEFSKDSVLTVLELILQNSLYRGEEHKGVLEAFLLYKRGYDALPEENKDNYAWEQSVKAGHAVGRIRNHAIGTLLINISEGMSLDTAVKKYEDIVAGPNYKRPKPIYTQRMLDEAKSYIMENGYGDSLARRYAKLDDITVNNILFCNRDAAKRISGTDVFGEMSQTIPVNSRKFTKVEEIGIADFVENVLPITKELEVLLENRHARNMVSLIAPVNKDSKSMFKWSNGFSWAYTGNITDSDMRENVKAAGGCVDGVLRFSIQWNDGTDYNPNDFDAHCIEPQGGIGTHIYFNSKGKRLLSSGMLDVDIQCPNRSQVAVENINWLDKSQMPEGTYQFFVHNYSHNGGRSGFTAEIEFDGQIYSFEYGKELRQDERVQVAEVALKNGVFSIKEKIPSNVSSRELWSLQTNQFVPVSVVMYSPNYWDEQSGIGHRHYFFTLKECINPEMPNGFYNEFLKEEFSKYKHVTEALGGKLAVEAAEDQLSGLGFSSTKRADLIVKVRGTTERVLKVKF